MKKLIIVLLLAAPALTMAQPKTIADLQKAYEGKKGVTVVKTSPEMMGLAFTDNKDNTLGGNVSILSAETSLSITRSDIKKIAADALRIASAPGNKLIMEVSDGEDKVYVYTVPTSKQDTLAGVYVIALEEDEVSVISVTGSIPANQLKKIAGMAEDMD